MNDEILCLKALSVCIMSKRTQKMKCENSIITQGRESSQKQKPERQSTKYQSHWTSAFCIKFAWN